MKDYKIKDMKEKEVLILGGMGAIGSNIAHTSVELGAKVTIFDNMMEGTGANPANIKEIKNDIKFVKGDIRNFEELKEVIKNKAVIFNCAAQVNHVLSMQNPFLDIDINCKGQINVLEACRKFNDSAKMIYAGTRSQFGIPQKIPLDENCLDNPTDIYSVNKIAGELYHWIYHNSYGLKTVSLRLTNTYGPRAQTNNPGYNVVNWMIGRSMLNQDLTIFKPGAQLRDLIYSQDAVDALILASQSKKCEGEVFVVGCGKGTSLVDLAKEIVKISGKGNIKLVPWPAERKAMEVGDITIDYSKIKKVLGWYPKTPMTEGLKKTIDFYRDNFSDYFEVKIKNKNE
jgi:UDP-glucose 4-epimerase